MFRYLMFDVVGTLIQPVIPVPRTYHEFGCRFGSKFSESEITQRFQSSFRNLFVNRVDPNQDSGDAGETNEQDQRNRWRDLVKSVFVDVESIDNLFEELWNYYSMAHAWCLYKDVALNWPKLESIGVTICLASNFDERLFRISKDLEPLNLAQHVFCSSRIGFEKPGSGFYRAIEEQLPQGKLMMVGDDLRNDYTAPRDAGWQAILLDRNGRHSVEQSVHSLGELVIRLSSDKQYS